MRRAATAASPVRNPLPTSARLQGSTSGARSLLCPVGCRGRSLPGAGRAQQQGERRYVFDGDLDGAGQAMLEGDARIAIRGDRQFDTHRAVSQFVRDTRDRRVDRAVLRPWESVKTNARALAAPDAAGGGRGKLSDGDD